MTQNHRITTTTHERLVLSMAAAAVANGAQGSDSSLLSAVMDVLNSLSSGRVSEAQERLSHLAEDRP